MVKSYQSNLYKALKISFIGLTLPLLLNSNIWASNSINPKIKQPLDLLIDDDPENNQTAFNQLKQIPDAVDLLSNELQNNDRQDVRHASAGALIKIAPTEHKTVQALIDALKDEDKDIRSYAAGLLGYALWKIPSPSRQLDKALKEVKSATHSTTSNWQVRLGAAEALGSSGRDVKTAVSTLNELLQDKDIIIRQTTLKSFSYMGKSLLQKATHLNPQERANAKEGLSQAIQVLKAPKDDLNNVVENIDEIRNSLETARTIITTVEEKDPINPIYQIYQWCLNNPTISIPTVLFLLWLLGIRALLWIYPLWLLRIDDFLERFKDMSLPNFLGGIQLTVLKLLLHGVQYHPRVLDAWVKSNLKKAHLEFQNKETVRERESYISVEQDHCFPIPVVLKNKNIPQLTAKHLQQYFEQQHNFCLLISGENGSGKTTLACQLAIWAMSDKPDERLCKHQMLPILIEQNLDDINVKEGKNPFTERIRGLLKELIDGQKSSSKELLEQLLIRQRLLVIIDGFSEMSQSTRDLISSQLTDADFPVNTLVVTSRNEEKLGGVNKTTIKMLKYKKG